MTSSASLKDQRARAATLREAVQRIDAVPAMLRLISAQTRLRFSAVAHVTDDLWVLCAVHDLLDFGLVPGSELPVETTLCIEAKQQNAPVVIEHASEDPAYCRHHTPKLYKFESYISVPILLRDGSHFGNLCALDPLPQPIANPQVRAMFDAYAALLGHLLDRELAHEDTVQLLAAERSVAVSREQFIAVVAHDLRNPLSAIAAGTEFLKRHDDPKVAKLANRMRDSTGRMAALLNDLVDFARGRAGKSIAIKLSHQPTFAAALSSVVQEIGDGHPGARIAEDFQVESQVFCDLTRIQQLLSNLLANAIAYGEEGALIQVRVARDADEAVLSVTNQGNVIPPPDLARLFDPYWRSEGHEKSTSLGLGLHICAQIVKAHEGKLTATSSAEEGTRFEARWPAFGESAG
jgi:signal transduction histidine kinase